MNSLMKSMLLLLLAGGALVFAGGGLEQPPGEPPHGVAVQGDAPGTKLVGEIFVEFYSIQSNGSANARFVLRLRKGSDFAVFYDEAFVSDFTSPSIVQTAITTEMVPQVVDRFFGNNNGIFTDDGTHDVRLKSLEEFGKLDTPTTVLGNRSVFILSDLVIAVR